MTIALQHAHVRDLLDPENGVAIIQSKDLELRWFAEEAKRLEPLSKHNPSAKTVAHTKFICLDSLSQNDQTPWKYLAHIIATSLNKAFESHEYSESLVFDDLYLTYFQKSERAVDIHRDVNCKGVVVTVNLFGNVPIGICDENKKTRSISLSYAHEITILRAQDFANLPKPYHYIGAINHTPTIQFGMRQYIKKPNKK